VRNLAAAALVLLLAPSTAPATDPPAAAVSDCAAPNNRILGPRTQGRLLPLMSGDATHGFRPACTLPWSAISPKNEPLPVSACFRGALLQVDIDAVCGAGKGKLWISSRWVVTSAEPAPRRDKAASCQQLQTGAYAATRTLPPPCVPSRPAQ
jgi:hypothetical protein